MSKCSASGYGRLNMALKSSLKLYRQRIEFSEHNVVQDGAIQPWQDLSSLRAALV